MPPTESSQLEFDDVAPNASSMIESMRAYGYSLPTAIADIVDNSIAAGCSNVWLRFHWAGAGSWISVTDDGRGMSEEDLKNAMRLGSRNPLEDRSPSDLGRFGLGLKTATFSQCRRLTVATKPAGGQQSIRRWDLDHLARSDVAGWQLLRSAACGSEDRAALPAAQDHGTVVLWEELDRVVSVGTDEETASIHRHFLEAVERVEAHLAMVFHRFLTSGRLRIHVNDRRVTAWDPFLSDHPATQPTPPEAIRVQGHADPVVVKGYILPHKDRLSDEQHAAAAGPAGWNAQQGFYIYRSERLIVAGSWLGLGGSRPWTQEEHYKLARIRLDIPNSMDHLWHLDVKKSSASPPPLLRGRLRGVAVGIRQDARAVYAHRGRYRARVDRMEMVRPWKVMHTQNRTAYRIDRNHPLIASVVSAVPRDLQDLLGAALRIIEETVPVEQIWLDTAERPDAPARPFDGVASTEARSLVTIAYRALRRNRAATHEEAIELLCACEEFATPEFRAVIATLEADTRP